MRERKKRGAHNTSTTQFTPSNVLTTAQNVYEWSVRSEERRTLIDTEDFQCQFKNR